MTTHWSARRYPKWRAGVSAPSQWSAFQLPERPGMLQHSVLTIYIDLDHTDKTDGIHPYGMACDQTECFGDWFSFPSPYYVFRIPHCCNRKLYNKAHDYIKSCPSRWPALFSRQVRAYQWYPHPLIQRSTTSSAHHWCWRCTYHMFQSALSLDDSKLAALQSSCYSKAAKTVCSSDASISTPFIVIFFLPAISIPLTCFIYRITYFSSLTTTQ